MADARVFLDYTIYLTDATQVATLQAAPALYHLPRNSVTAGVWRQEGVTTNLFTPHVAGALPGDVYASPLNAALRYGCPVLTTGDEMQAPCIKSPWIPRGLPPYDTGKDDFVLSTGGFFGLFTDDTNYIWRGRFAYVAPASLTTGDGITAVEGLKARRWIDGFEQPEQGDGGTGGGLALNFTRAASRHADGYGLAIRATDGVKSHTIVEFGAAASPSSWERLYVRATAFPTSTVTFWRSRSSAANNAGLQLAINPTGRIVLYDTDNANVKTQLGTSTPLVLNQYTRVDVLLSYGAAASCELWVNGVQVLNIVSVGVGGLATVGNHASSEVGQNVGQSTGALGLDLDDWVNAARPSFKTGNDWTNGSKIVKVNVTGFAADMANWAGDWRTAIQTPAEDATALLTSSTSGARLSFTTDADETCDREPGALGCTALVVGKYGLRAGVDDGTLGYTIGEGVETLAAIVEDVAPRWDAVLFTHDGALLPTRFSPLTLIHEKAASVDLATVKSLGASVELCGVFGPEDIAIVTAAGTPAGVLGNTGLHNAPYPRTAWAVRGTAPLSPVVIIGGTYAGNGVGQDLSFHAPVNFFFVRRVNNANDGSLWWSSQVAAHHGFRQRTDPAGMVEALIDPTYDAADGLTAQQTLLRITGGADQVNKAGETYQYIAVCDPGMRFMLNGALQNPSAGAARSTTLVNTNFLPEAGWFVQEAMNGSSGIETWYKGAAHTTTLASKLGSIDSVNGVTFNRGTIVAGTDLEAAVQAIGFMLWRQNDGSADPGLPKVVQIFSWLGDGTGNRTIALPRVSSVRPLLALVVSLGEATAVMRDPSHTGTTSLTVPTTQNAANGLRGGDIDALLVGSDLNTNGKTYSAFVLMGSATAGNNGWSINGEFVPVIPAVPVDGPWIVPPTGDPSVLVLPDGDTGGDTGGTVVYDFGAQCIGASTLVANRALAAIGVTVPITDVVNDPSVEAAMVRLYYQEDVEFVLRDFPWPFATAYKALALATGGDLVAAGDDSQGRDWRYVYLLPADFIFARRLCRAGVGRRFDPHPPRYRIVRGPSDAPAGTRGMLYANEASVVLEYTFRPVCAAGAGDASFRDALKWRLAADLAPSIARNKVTTEECMKLYEIAKSTASTHAANEQQGEPGNGDAEWIEGRDGFTGSDADWIRGRG